MPNRRLVPLRQRRTQTSSLSAPSQKRNRCRSSAMEKMGACHASHAVNEIHVDEAVRQKALKATQRMLDFARSRK